MYTGNEEADSNSKRNVNCSYRQTVLADSVQFKHMISVFELVHLISLK